MNKRGQYYRICSCGAKITTTSKTTIKNHRDRGHKIPMKRYRWEE